MANDAKDASKQIDERIEELADWRGKTLAEVRKIIKAADPDVVEEWKWAKATSPGTPVWSHDGIICTGETYKAAVKLTFMKGASLKDPKGLFNSSLEGNTRRAIDIKEGEKVDAAALKKLSKKLSPSTRRAAGVSVWGDVRVRLHRVAAHRPSPSGTDWRLLTTEGVSTVVAAAVRKFLQVEPSA